MKGAFRSSPAQPKPTPLHQMSFMGIEPIATAAGAMIAWIVSAGLMLAKLSTTRPRDSVRGERWFDREMIATEQETTMSTSGNPGEHKEKRIDEKRDLVLEQCAAVRGGGSGGNVE